MFIEFRMGYFVLIGCVCIARVSSTSVFTRFKTGTAFVQDDGKQATFYQDIIQTTVNVEIEAPRILLEYERYAECDNSFEIKGVPMCQFQFNEFDNGVFDFLNLKLTKKRNLEWKDTR